MPTRRLAIVAAAIALISLSLPSVAQPARAATTWNYPTDCGPTIQDCVNGAADGDVIHVFQNDPGASISINKSLTLVSGNGTLYTVGVIGISDLSTAVLATVDGLSAHPFINVYFNSASGSSAVIRNVTVTGANGYASAVSFDGEITSSFTLERSAVTGANGNVLGLLVTPNGGQINTRVVGNRFNAHGNAQSGPGIQLTTLGSGTVTVDIYNNSIWDVGRNMAGAASGIALLPSGTVHADVNLVGNTVAKSATDGLQQRNSLASGGVLALDMFNNSFTNSRRGVSLTKGLAGTLVFRAGYNNSYANVAADAYDGLPKGPGNLAVAPRFVSLSAGNLRLKSTSGLINKGQVCSPGGVANPDAAGHHRVAGTSVDIGAFERSGFAISGVVLLGSNGPDLQSGGPGADILCGYGGIDEQHGAGGADWVDGGGGNDILYGGPGPDRMFGGKGNDKMCANDGTGTDYVNGGSGTDSFRVDSGDIKKSLETATMTC